MPIFTREHIENSGGDPTNLRLSGQVNDASAGSICKLEKLAKNVKAIYGYTDVFIHGRPSGTTFAVLHEGKWVDFSHRQLATWLGQQGVKGDVRLISCYSGMLNTGSVAQNLANKLGVTVMAPTNAIFVHPNGTLTAPLGTIWKILVPGAR